MPALRIGGVVLGMIIAAGARAGVPVDALQFDLKCYGQFEDRAQDTTGWFWERVRVDLQKGRFCIEECQSVQRLTRFDARTVEYHYDQNSSDPKLNAQPPYQAETTAGPFFSKLDMTFDRRTGSYRRRDVLLEGDIVGVSHDDRYTGSCVLRPFSGLPAPDHYHRWSD